MHDIVLKIPVLPVTLPAEDVIFPVDVIVPLVEILPVDDMSHCDVHTPTPVCAPTENPPFVLDQSLNIKICSNLLQDI